MNSERGDRSGAVAAGEGLSRAADGVPRWQRAYLIACGAIVLGILGLCAADFGRWARPIYLPYARSWQWTSDPPAGVAMGYYGLLVWALAGAAVGAAAIAVGARLWRRPLPPNALSLVGAWTLTAAVFGVAYFAWTIAP